MAEIFTVETRGIGKPDYSKEVSSARERAGISLAYNQTLKLFLLQYSNNDSPYPWVFPLLAEGGSQYLIDSEQGLEMPFTVAEGYILSEMTFVTKTTEDRKYEMYIDGNFLACHHIATGGQVVYEDRVLGAGTDVIDPTGSEEHTWGILMYNIGLGELEGGSAFFYILEEVGTASLPPTKTVKCKWCGNLETVPKEITRYTCPKCGKLTLYYDLSKFRRN